MNHKIALCNPDPSTRIRPVRLHDVDDMVGKFWPDRPRDSVADIIKRAQRIAMQERGLGIVVVGAGKGELRGYGQLTIWPHAAEISDLYVPEAHRCKGIGTTMIQYLTRCAREMNAPAVEIGVALSNPLALSLYRRIGFESRNELLLDLGSGPETVLYLQIRFDRATNNSTY